MDTVLFGDITVLRLLLWGGGALVVLAGIAILRKLLGGPPRSQHQQTALCPKCGWKGTVSRYAGKCPRCNEPLGDAVARGPRG